ncbi:MAG: LuxR family transcriptional regulator [Hyphomicrobiales bacterium]|nr:LuxR family transcriptional regulator [Hyphomicrobiales bacterium]
MSQITVMSTISIDAAAQKLTDAIFSGDQPLNETLTILAADLGLSHISYIRMGKGQDEDLSVLTAVVTYPWSWQLRYFLKQYIKIDPVIRRGRLAVIPFDWEELIAEGAAAIAFFEDARAHGVGQNGLTIPIRSRKNWASIVSYTSNHSYEEWQEYKNANLAKLNIISLLIDNAASRDFALPRPEVKLSERELQCLIWSARGKTYKEIADIVGVSYSTVKFYLDTARHKLNCSNVTHAVAVAIASGIIPSQALKGGL